MFYCSTIRCSTCLLLVVPQFHHDCSTFPPSDVVLFQHLFSTLPPSDISLFHHGMSYCSTTIGPLFLHLFSTVPPSDRLLRPFINLLRLTFPNLYHRKTQGVGTILDQITANFLTFHHASLFPRLVIDLFIWLPLNYGTIFPFLLEIYLQLMLSRRLLKLIYFRRRFPANLLFLFSLLRRICI